MHGDAALSKPSCDREFPDSTLERRGQRAGDAERRCRQHLLQPAARSRPATASRSGGILLGAAEPVHILTPSATVRRIVNMTALAVVDADARSAAPRTRSTDRAMSASSSMGPQRGAPQRATARRCQDRAHPDQGRGRRRLAEAGLDPRAGCADGARFHEIKRILREQKLHTVCEEASCPNIGECFGKGTATFMILGDLCTRRCPFCDVAHGRPLPPDAEEPRTSPTPIARAEAALRRHHQRRPRRPARRRRAAFRRLHPRGARALAATRASRCWCPTSAAGSTARSTSSPPRRPT